MLFRSAGLEIEVRFANDPGVGEGGKAVVEVLDCLGWIGVEEFLGLPDSANLEIRLEQLEDVQDVWDAAREGDVDGLDLAPVGEGPVADNEGIRVANTGDEVEDVWI